ncbi:MAG: HEAT repeat domain-containing protein [Gemmataceae bacterium]
MKAHVVWLLLTITLLGVGTTRGQRLLPTHLPYSSDLPQADSDVDEKILRDAKIATDREGLLRFFRDRTMTPARSAKLERLVEQLSSQRYITRVRATSELAKGNSLTLRFLQKTIDKEELEVQNRIKRCIETIQQRPHLLHTRAALRLLTKKRPNQSEKVLLDYLPYAQWDVNSSELLEALKAVSISNQQDATVSEFVLAATKAEHSRKRYAAVYVLKYASPKYKSYLYTLLNDPNTETRYFAAEALLYHYDNKGVKTLLSLLGDAPLSVARQAEEILIVLNDNAVPPHYLKNDVSVRLVVQQHWRNWWKRHGHEIQIAKTKLKEYLSFQQLGLVVTCEISRIGDYSGQIVAYDRNGQVRWMIDDLRSPTDFQLLGPHRVLVAEHWAKRVTERNRKGETLWQYDTPTHAVSCQRLRNGNTLIACQTEVVIVTPTKEKVFSHSHTNWIYHAEQSRDGHIVYVDNKGQVTELDQEGSVVVRFRPKSYAKGAWSWSSVTKLKENRYLITYSGTNKVVESDGKGTVLWSCDVPNTTWAFRKRNGMTWACEVDNRAIRLVDREGKQVKRWQIKGRPFSVRVY